MKKREKLSNALTPLIQKRNIKSINRLPIFSSDDERQKLKKKKFLNIKNEKFENKITVNGYCISNAINFTSEINLEEENLFIFQELEETDCKIYKNNKKYLFIFDFGVLIFWNFTSQSEKQIQKKLTKFLIKKLNQSEIEKDMMLCSKEIFQDFKIENNTICLSTNDIKEKYAHSYAFAQSLKIDMFEQKLEKTIKKTEQIPKQIAIKGKINLSQEEVYKTIGNIFMLRSSVNLLSGLLDVPDYFWEQAELEEIYAVSREYYDVEERICIINNRLDLIKELYDMLNDDLHNKHASNLEWIVIWLIVIEVLIEVIWNILIKDVFKLVS